jgi:hypothetical protein
MMRTTIAQPAPAGMPAGYAILEESPAGTLREGITYVTRSLAEARGWIASAPAEEWDQPR